jgi:hypothetical protein
MGDTWHGQLAMPADAPLAFKLVIARRDGTSFHWERGADRQLRMPAKHLLTLTRSGPDVESGEGEAASGSSETVGSGQRGGGSSMSGIIDAAVAAAEEEPELRLTCWFDDTGATWVEAPRLEVRTFSFFFASFAQALQRVHDVLVAACALPALLMRVAVCMVP